jgi:hypothetical protein
MSGLGGGHVWEIPLESSPEAGYTWLTQEKAKRPDMSGLGWTCPARVSGIRLGAGYVNLTGNFGGRIDF